MFKDDRKSCLILNMVKNCQPQPQGNPTIFNKVLIPHLGNFITKKFEHVLKIDSFYSAANKYFRNPKKRMDK